MRRETKDEEDLATVKTASRTLSRLPVIDDRLGIDLVKDGHC